MIADLLFSLYIVFMVCYCWIMKYRYDDIIKYYVKMKMKWLSLQYELSLQCRLAF